MNNLPRGTVTFLFTDIEGSTKLWQHFPSAMPNALARHHEILRQAIEAHDGYVFQIIGDAFCAALTGAGGSGKTRLSLQIAADVIDEFEKGSWFVELAPIADPALVPSAVLNALGLREEAGLAPPDALTDYLRAKKLFLVLDNCEHLIDACAQLAHHLLTHCPNLKILATSREALGIAGEVTYQVPSLGMPDDRRQTADDAYVTRITQYDAVRLFIERAVAVQSNFSVTNANAPAVAQICFRLDGIPLAIELAAARIKLFSPEQIAARLDDRFRLLTGGSRTAMPRQQTLRAAIEWSYSLLSEQERILFRRLAVFAGGWTFEAAEAVCSEQLSGDRNQSSVVSSQLLISDVLDTLAQLVNKSLVTTEARGDETRYRMLETIREYVRERLNEAGESEKMDARHLEFFLQFAEQAEPHLAGLAQADWLKRLETEHDNLRAALRWSAQAPVGAEQELRLAGALWRFWYMRGYFNEGQGFLETVLKRNSKHPSGALAKGFNGAGMMAFAQGAYKEAQKLLEESVELYKEIQDELGTAFALTNLALQFYSQGKFAHATSLLEESLALARQNGDKQMIALALNGLGEVARYQADNTRARAFYKESLALARNASDKQRIMEPLFNLGTIAHRQGEHETARSLFKEGLLTSQQVGDKRLLAMNLGGLAGVCGTLGELERAARLFGAAESLRQEIHYQMEKIDRIDYDRDVSAVREQLGVKPFETTWAEGRALTLEQAIELALREGLPTDGEQPTDNENG